MVSKTFPAIALLLLTSCAPKTMGHTDEVDQWHAKRIASLKKEHGWLSLVALEWLQEGENVLGSAGDVTLPAPAAPKLGTLTLTAGKVRWNPVDGVPRDLKTDADEGGPDKVVLGRFAFVVIKRKGRWAARVWDSEAKTRVEFQGIERWPVSAKWKIEAKWEAYEPAKKVVVPNVIPGLEDELEVPGAAVFMVEGTEHRLEPVLEEGDTPLFFIFGDATNGKETYGAGRFLYVKAPKDGKVVLDFNRAYNPPCAFTPFATCPLPTAQNRLPVRVDAGEKTAGAH